jgi:pyruvate kinase
MKEIIENTEASPFDDVKHLMTLNGNGDFEMVIKSAYELAKSSNAKAVVLGSASGFTARLFSHFRPEQPMLVVTHNKKTFHQLALVWGIDAKLYEKGEVFREDIDWLIEDAKKQGTIANGDKIVLILGRTPDGEHIRLIGIKEV